MISYPTTIAWITVIQAVAAEPLVFRAIVGGKQAFSITAGTRVVTVLAGKPLEIVGISPGPQTVALTTDSGTRRFTVRPNEVIRIASTITGN